jgi:DNA-directed RNA polymerase specialized sigma24 family protein
MEPLAVDVREASRLLSLSSRTIRRHIQWGRLNLRTGLPNQQNGDLCQRNWSTE